MTHKKNAIRTNTRSKKSQHFPLKSASKIGRNRPFLKPFDTFLTHSSDILTGNDLTEAGTVNNTKITHLLATKNLCLSRTNASVHISALLSDCWERLFRQRLSETHLSITGTPLDISLFTLQNREL
jgi:hypothetical protein